MDCTKHKTSITAPINYKHLNLVFFLLVYFDNAVSAGLIVSGCLPVFASGEFEGVTCVDLKVDTFFSEIIDFHLEKLSYSMLVDSRGRIQIHPLLPIPERYPEVPIFLDMESVEISSDISDVKRAILR